MTKTEVKLQNINMLSKEKYESIEDLASDELYAISGSGFGFPSSNYDDLELGASGTQYTAPANGWVYIDKASTAAGQYITIENVSDGASGESCNYTAYASNYDCALLRPIKKGKTFQVRYSLAGTTKYFRFIYAEGE